MRARLLSFLVAGLLPAVLGAQVLSRSVPLDYIRDITSRNLTGLAARADGRLTAGPFLTDLKGPALGPLAWSLAALPDGRWLIGTGPSGRVWIAKLGADDTPYQLETYIDLPASHIQALLVAPNGDVVAAGGPKGAVFLLRDRKLIARANLPAETVHALVADPSDPNRVFAATGNPGRIFSIDLKTFASVAPAPVGQPAVDWPKQGIAQFGEIKDRHLRRLISTPEGLVGGSSPRGHIYRFPAAGGPGVIVMENKDTEVTGLLRLPDGDLLATLVVAAPETENRVAGNTPTPVPANAGPAGTPPQGNPPRPAPTPFDRFNGRSLLVRLPLNGAPEPLAQRNNTAFYDLAITGDWVLVAGGESGDLLAYDLKARLPMTLAGSPSAQLLQLRPLPDQQGHLVLRNNPAGLSVLADRADRARRAETKRIDLGTTGRLGAWRPARIRGVDTNAVTVEVRTSRTADEAEGWTPWQKLGLRDDGWSAPGLVARHVKYRLSFPAGSSPLVDRAEAFLLPENRRPGLGEFKYLPPNYEVRPGAEGAPSSPNTVGALLSEKTEARNRPNTNGLPVAPVPGMQAAVWSFVDADGDALAASLSIRLEGSDPWIDLAVDRREPFVQFATSALAEGHYRTRITITEQEPRPAAERLSYVAETDSLVIDRTGPEILKTEGVVQGNDLVITVEARDALSLLDQVDFVFNQGASAALAQPADGVRDSRHETFVFRAPHAEISASTSVEIAVFDAVGNATRLRLALPRP